MMIEPPGDFRRVRIFEVHDHVFVTVKKTVGPRLYRTMGHAGQFELRVGIKTLAVKTIKSAAEAVPSKQRSWKHRRTRVINWRMPF